MTVERKKIQPDEQLQMYIFFLKEKINPILICRKIMELGGQPFQYLPKQSIMLAQLKVKTADNLKGFEGVKHMGSVSFNPRIRKLRVKTDSTGKPLWHYKIGENNNIYMIKASNSLK